MPHSYTNLLVHVVFGTKNREPLLTEALRPGVLQFLTGGIREFKGIPLEVNGRPDHVHLLIKIRPDLRLSELLRDIKARSSGWIHHTFPGLQHFAWQAGYGAFSVDPISVEMIRNYIRNQEQHHQNESFESEYLRLLDAAGIEYDLRYLWE